MKNYLISNKKGLILVFVGLIVLVVMFFSHNKAIQKELLVSSISMIDANISEPESKRVLSEEELASIYINDNIETVNFLADVFKIDKDILVERLKSDYQSINLVNNENLEYTLIEYLLALEDTDEDLFDNSLDPCDDSKEYILSLLKYFSNIYNNVDFSIAAAIIQIESGFTVQSMLNKNNVFGGMSGGSLIRYKNIEYGILRYVKLLSDGYFGKGLITVEDIGRVYNPIFNESGVKIANPSWVSKVNNAMDEFVNIEAEISVAEILALKNVEEN